MATSSNVRIRIHSMRCKKTFEIERFTEFDVPLDLETDSDAFDLVTENPNGLYTGLFCRFDKCYLYINKVKIMEGNVDSVTYYISASKDYIKISGRDLCWKLVDNDSLPDTLKNVQPKKYIEQRCKSYGIKCKVSSADVYKKLVIGCEESEISIFNNILLDSRQRIWFLVDTLYTGSWNTGASPKHTFCMSSKYTGIPIISVEYKEDGTDMISKMLVYGSTSDGDKKVMGQYENKFMVKNGIQKRSVKRHYSDSASIKYTTVAERSVRENFRDDTEMKIVVPIKDVYMPNTTCKVIISKLGINAVFFIKAVQYTKGLSDGGTATLTLIPADSAFESLWNSSTALSMTKYTSKSKVLANGK